MGPVIPQRQFQGAIEAAVSISSNPWIGFVKEARGVARTALDASPGAGRLTLFLGCFESIPQAAFIL